MTHETPIVLTGLIHLHVRATRHIWHGLYDPLTAPFLTAIHVDIICPSWQMTNYSFGGTYQNSVREAANFLREKLLTTRTYTLSLHYQHGVNEDTGGELVPRNWSEIMRFNLTPTDALAPDAGSYAYTVRSAMTSPPGLSPPERAKHAPEPRASCIFEEFLLDVMTEIESCLRTSARIERPNFHLWQRASWSSPATALFPAVSRGRSCCS